MKLICSKTNLFNALSIVSKAVPNKTTMSILECILIDATSGQIILTANDTEMGIQTIVGGTILERGRIALDAKILFEIIRRLPDNDVTITTDPGCKSVITCEKAKFNIMGKTGDDFTGLPEIERKESLVISQFTLKEMIRQTIFSISDNDSNKLMSGELFEINGNTMRVASLDGHRISIRNIALRESYPYRKVVVPGKTLSEISKILSGDAQRDVTIYFTDNHILFAFDQTTVVSRLVEGEYFKVDAMLSKDYETKVQVRKRELFDCIDRATLLTREGDKKPVILQITDDSMELMMRSALGSMDEQIDISKEGKDLMIGFNPKFLIDALRVIDEDTITMYMVGPKAPCFIRDEEDSYIYLILPVNFSVI